MVKKHMAMRMLTIFVALIVCGMFFPDLARGEDSNVNAVLTEGGNTLLNVELGDVVLGDPKTASVGITNESITTTYTVTLLLNSPVACTSEFTYNGPSIVTNFLPGDSLDVEVTYTPSALGACNAALQITYYGSPGGLVEISFNGNGIEEASDSLGPVVIGNSPTGVMNKMIDESTNFTLQDMIDDCNNKDEFKNHGGCVRCIASKTRDLMEEGFITGNDRNELVSAAARAHMQSLIEKWKERRNRLKSSKGHYKHWWVWSGE